ncbi:MAG: sigma-70 family RNA polymerase sigma factor [Flavobacteriaceae bacterium]
MNIVKKETNDKNALWANFVNGNQKAFASIYNEHIASLYVYGCKICQDQDLIKDCIQDVFIDLFQNGSQLSVPRNIKFYLFKVLKHCVYRRLKKERKYGELSARSLDFFQTEYCIERKIIHSEIEKSRKRFIHLITNELSSRQQEILYLRFTMAFTYREISEILIIDHNSVRKQVYRAIKKLRESDTFKDRVCLLPFLQH